MASSASDLEYDHASKKRFKEYFLQPKPKRGRPKKKKRGRPKKSKSKSTAQTKITSSKRKTIDLTIDEESPKQKKLAGLDARLHGAVQSSKRYSRSHVIRTNWEDAKHSQLRDRIADSWEKKTDLYKEGESFNKFCIRCGINRNVLKRYLERRGAVGLDVRPRGRPPLLDKSVMVHLCEGKCLCYGALIVL